MNNEAPAKRINASDAIDIFNKALEWAGDEGVDQSDVNVLRRLREKTVFQLLENKNQQNKLLIFSINNSIIEISKNVSLRVLS